MGVIIAHTASIEPIYMCPFLTKHITSVFTISDSNQSLLMITSPIIQPPLGIDFFLIFLY